MIVATYRGRFLRETLASVFAQTFVDFEVLVLDDANEAVCRELVRSFGDVRLRYVANEKQLGPARNHLEGFRLAQGDLVAVLNHDDLWTPNVLERLVRGYDGAPGAVAAFSRTRVASRDGSYSPERTGRAWALWDLDGLPVGIIANWYRMGTSRIAFPLGPATVVRTEAVRAVDVPRMVGGAYDYWVGYRLAALGPVVHVPDAVAYWREHDENLSRRRSLEQSMELIYINAAAALDGRLPAGKRFRAARAVPIRLALAARQGLRDVRACCTGAS